MCSRAWPYSPREGRHCWAYHKFSCSGRDALTRSISALTLTRRGVDTRQRTKDLGA